jgi:hypothetical protein
MPRVVNLVGKAEMKMIGEEKSFRHREATSSIRFLWETQEIGG